MSNLRSRNAFLVDHRELAEALRLVVAADGDSRQSSAWAWVARALPIVQREARHRLPPSEWEDAAQEVLLGLMEKARDGRLLIQGAQRPEPWLRTIVVRMLIDRSRSVQRRMRRTEPITETHELPSEDPELDQGLHGCAAVDTSLIQPVDALVLLSIAAPEIVEERHVRAAVQASRPPTTGLTRDAETTWRLLERWRTATPRANSELYFILRGPSHLASTEAWGEVDARQARNWAHTRFRRARQAALARHLRGSRQPRLRGPER